MARTFPAPGGGVDRGRAPTAAGELLQSKLAAPCSAARPLLGTPEQTRSHVLSRRRSAGGPLLQRPGDARPAGVVQPDVVWLHGVSSVSRTRGAAPERTWLHRTGEASRAG